MKIKLSSIFLFLILNFLALNSKIELKLAEETRVREEAVVAAQAYDDINQECSDHGNQARNLEMNVAKTETELRYSTPPQRHPRLFHTLVSV